MGRGSEISFVISPHLLRPTGLHLDRSSCSRRPRPSAPGCRHRRARRGPLRLRPGLSSGARSMMPSKCAMVSSTIRFVILMGRSVSWRSSRRAAAASDGRVLSRRADGGYGRAAHQAWDARRRRVRAVVGRVTPPRSTAREACAATRACAQGHRPAGRRREAAERAETGEPDEAAARRLLEKHAAALALA
jgi:hypothetical protein